jgi:hypothetical protein
MLGYSGFDLADAIAEIVDHVFPQSAKDGHTMFADAHGFRAEFQICVENGSASKTSGKTSAEQLIAQTLEKCGCKVEFRRVAADCVTRTLSVTTNKDPDAIISELQRMKTKNLGIYAYLETPKAA